MDKRMEHTARIIWMIGQTEVELISSVCKRGRICCISSCPRLSPIVVVGRRQGCHSPNRLPSVCQWQLPGQARPILSLSSHRASCTRRRRRRCRQTQSRLSSPPLRSTMPFIPLSRSVLPPIFFPLIVISQRDNRP